MRTVAVKQLHYLAAASSEDAMTTIDERLEITLDGITLIKDSDGTPGGAVLKERYSTCQEDLVTVANGEWGRI
jgi:hypothetical protein